MLATIALTALVAASPSADQIYASARLPFGLEARRSGVLQVLSEQRDGTFAGVIQADPAAKPGAIWSHVDVETSVGEWSAVSRQIGNVRDARGTVGSLEQALRISPDGRPEFLIVSAVESAVAGPEKSCAVLLVGVSEGRSFADDRRELLARPVGLLAGCGAVKDVVRSARPDFTQTAEPEAAWRLGQDHLLKAMADTLHLEYFVNTIILDGERSGK